MCIQCVCVCVQHFRGSVSVFIHCVCERERERESTKQKHYNCKVVVLSFCHYDLISGNSNQTVLNLLKIVEHFPSYLFTSMLVFTHFFVCFMVCVQFDNVHACVCVCACVCVYMCMPMQVCV